MIKYIDKSNTIFILLGLCSCIEIVLATYPWFPVVTLVCTQGCRMVAMTTRGGRMAQL